jgi:uncharacterized protein
MPDDDLGWRHVRSSEIACGEQCFLGNLVPGHCIFATVDGAAMVNPNQTCWELASQLSVQTLDRTTIQSRHSVWSEIMKSQLVAESAGQRTFVVVLDPGEEAFAALTSFAVDHDIGGASLTALGAFEKATVGWFDIEEKTYRKIPVLEQCEVLSAIGDVAIGDDGKPSLHVHAVLGLRDGSTKGGHLLDGIVRPTLEVTLVETPGHLRRRKRPELGIALIDLDA